MTRKLYYEALYQREFEAAIQSQEERDGRARVVLDQTLFYPSGGGQPCDLGTLGDANVLEVFEEGEDIVHVLDRPIPGGTAHGVLDWDRRFELMQQHLGQHVFSATLHRLFSLRTARMRIEGDDVSIDLDVPVEESAIREAEAQANEEVWKNISVEILYPGMEEVRRLSRKLPPANSGPARIVKIEGVDYVPCCGLHVSATGEVGIIKVGALEHHKGGTRVHLRCGRPAFRWLDRLCRETRALRLELTCNEEGLSERVAGLKAQIRDLTAHNKDLLDRAAGSLAASLRERAVAVGRGLSVVAHALEEGPDVPEEAKRLLRLLTQEPGAVALLGGKVGPDKAFLLFGCNKDERGVDVREAFKAAIALIDGKGGGSPSCAQGFGRNPGQLDAALEAALEVMRRAS